MPFNSRQRLRLPPGHARASQTGSSWRAKLAVWLPSDIEGDTGCGKGLPILQALLVKERAEALEATLARPQVSSLLVSHVPAQAREMARRHRVDRA